MNERSLSVINKFKDAILSSVQHASSQLNKITNVPKGTAPSIGMLFKTFSICDTFLRSFGCNEQLSSIIISVGPQKTWGKNGNKYRQVKAPPELVQCNLCTHQLTHPIALRHSCNRGGNSKQTGKEFVKEVPARKLDVNGLLRQWRKWQLGLLKS